MSFTYRLFTTQSLLPGSYGLDITATSNNAYGSLLRSFIITEPGSPPVTADTLRSLTELLTVIWADGQGLNQLNAKDCRETVISLALQTADFSRLPRSTSGLPSGRVWVDSAGVVKVNI